MMTLYKGRIDTGSNALMDAINRSLPVDIRLLPYDVATNRAWAAELARIGVLDRQELTAVDRALDEILALAAEGAFEQLPEDEDVHTLVERLLTERLGDTGAKIHTGRSRNDQVACDLNLYLIDSLQQLDEKVVAAIRVLRELAEEHAAVLLAGTTHLQPAQPITLGHFLLSAAFALVRDAERVTAAAERASSCPLGCGALAGSGFAVDRQALADELGFARVAANSIDAISDRDAAQEAACACAILAGHLSRYAEQLVIWSHPALGYVRLADEWSTGSSMMPQKRNPDSLELVRAKAARAIGRATQLLALTKGVPLAYAKDLQEDKEALFDAIDTAALAVAVFGEVLARAEFREYRMREMLTGDLLATDLADRLVQLGVPFRKSHERVARLVGELEADSRCLLDATADEIAKHAPELGEEGWQPSFEAAIERRQVIGGTAPSRVRDQIAQLDTWLASKS
jgi:argininosuccinate lyase